MPMEDTYGIQSRIGSIIVVERWYCCRGSPVFSDRNIQSLQNRNILISGAAGFIGSNLVTELLKTQYALTIIGIDNMNNYYDVTIKD